MARLGPGALGGGPFEERARRIGRTLLPGALILLFQQIAFPIPAGVALNGVMVGLLTAMGSVGMALVYRANRILNFAQADLGYIPASLSVMIVITSGIPWVVAFGAGFIVAAALGAACELLIIRRFFRAPRLILTVATLGLVQLLAFGGLLLPRAFGERVRSQRLDPPFDLSFTVDPLVFNANHLLVLVIAPVAILSIGLFLQRTAVGVAIRAAADRSDRASLLGVPVKSLHTVVWTIAAVLAFLALFLRSGMIGLPIGSALSLDFLLKALAALIIGRMTHLPTITAAAIALGVLEMGVDWNGVFDQKSPLLISPVIFVVAVVALLLQKRDVSRFETDAASSWTTADEVRPVPRELRRLPEVRAARAAGFVLLAAVLLFLPHWVDTDESLKISVIFIFSLVVVSVVVITGWAGQVSLCQVAFMAIGATVGARATNDWGLDLLLALPLAGFAGLVAAVLVGLPALRVKGLFLAVTTLGFGVMASAWLLNPRFFGWIPTGRIERPDLAGQIDLNSPTRIYYFCLAVLVVVLAGLRGIRYSRTGRVLLAMRENERGAQSFGVSVTRAKLTAFGISGFVAAVAGALFIHHQQAFDDGAFGPGLSIVLFTSAVIGGLGSLTGGILGAIYTEGSFFLLPADWRFFSSALGVLFVLLVLPGGLGSVLFRVRDEFLRWVARRRNLTVPSLLADRRLDDDEAPPEIEVELVELVSEEYA
jgi:branched-chain amino acid transport system permease protein